MMQGDTERIMREGSAAIAFEHDSDDLRYLPLIDRNRRLAR